MSIFLIVNMTGCAWAQAAAGYKILSLAKGKVTFSLKPDDSDAYRDYCPNGHCHCDLDVDYVSISPVKNQIAANSINRRLRSDAAAVRCEYLDAVESLRQRVTHLSTRFVSVVEHGYSLQLSASGSCHGFHLVHSFDLQTGQEYFLRDIIDPSSIADLRSGIPKSIVAEQARRDKSGLPNEALQEHLEGARRALAGINDAELVKKGFFIENGRVFVDIGGYYFSCAEGSFHPAEIPLPLITLPALRSELAR